MSSSPRIKEVAALAPMQRGMLHDALLDPASAAHHEQLVLALEGPLDAARLEAVWQQVVDRHDALRGRFLGQRVSSPVQLIPQHEPVALQRRAIERPDQRGGPDGLPVELEEALQADRDQPFELESAHAMRLVLFSAGAQRHWLLWSFHHILLDGWSIGLVLDEVLDACCGATLRPPVDPAPWRRWLAARDTEGALAFWQRHLAGFRSEGLVGADTITTHAQATALLDAASTQRLRALAQAHQATLHHVLLAAWALTLGRSTDQQDVLVPTVLAGRPAELADADARVGLFINTVPMRVQWESGDSFASLLQRVQQASGEAARHQVLSLADIQARTGALPVDHVFLVQGLPGEAVVGRRCGDARVSAACFRESLPYALQVSLTPGPDGIGIVLQGRLESGSLQALANALRSLLAAVAAQPMRPLREHELLDAAQRATVLAWGDGGPAAGGGTLLQALDAQLARAPEAPALVCGEEHLSYRELHARANRLAHALLADGPLAPDTLVALVARRDAALVTGLLAILKAGAAYLPVDPEHPRQRVRQLLETAGCRHVLLAPGLQHVLPPSCGARVLPLAADAVAGQPDTPPECEVRPEQLAYVIFTSGSTGTPKGVMLTHANAASVLAAIPLAAGFQGPQRVLGATTVSFDISILELLGPLTWGGTLVLAGADEARDPAQLLGLVEREQVTVLQATPSRLRLLLAAEPDAARARAVLGRLGHVLVGGEALPAPLASELLALAPLRACNVYGPTETAIWSACWPLAPGPVRLGRALAGERLLVLSREGRLQPPGALGEIAIAGAGVARGYLNDPARTAARFVRLPDIAGPVYLTGDLGRWRTDGSLEFRGRRDDQVKLRGMRIELAELEQHLLRLPEVRAAAAAVREGPHGAELVAYLVGPAAADPPVLRAALAEALPAAMLPARFVLLDALPLTPAGKTDRRALPAAPALVAATPARPPASEREARICAVFAEVLGQPVGPDDDFFLCGGHSLLAIQAVGRINRALAAGYTLRDLYRAATPAALAALATDAGPPLRAEPPAADHPLSAQQQALWVLQQLQPDYAGYNVPGAYLVTGALDLDQLTRAWAAVVARHAALRTVFVRVDGWPRQQVLPRMAFAIERHALPPGADPEATVQEITCRPFDLERGPLFRLARIALDPARQLLLIVLHHIVSDGWSDALLTADLEQAWRAVRRGQDPLAALRPAPAIGYTDYARWQQRTLASPAARAHAEFWRSRLADLPRLALPATGARTQSLERPGARIAWRLEPAEAAQWLAACPARERHAALAAATLALLHAESGQHDLVLALPVANRDRPQLQEQAGLHLNLLPLRVRLAADATPQQLQRQCADGIVEALAHADYPFARLVEDLGLAAAPGRHPVADAMLIFHQQPTPLPRLEGVQVALHEGRSYRSRFDLDVEVWAADGAVHGFIEYDAGLFTPQQAEGFAARWKALLLAGCRAPQAPLAQLLPGRGPAADAQHFMRQALAVDEEF